MKNIYLISWMVLLTTIIQAQNFTTYHIGNEDDIVTTPLGGSCLMGGATENDNAIKWFLSRSGGGDVLVLRASGSDGYNEYFYSQLGIDVNAVETIVFHNTEGANDAYVHDKINTAEAIWIAGGDQWNYISYWRESPVATLINQAIEERNIVIGGTSAGMAILGGTYFSAATGTVTSEEALANPYNMDVHVDSTDFLNIPYLHNVITDTHYDNPDRRGRHVVFMGRAWYDWQKEIRGIAAEEYTAVCIDTSGVASVYGESPQYDDNAYFIRTNCLLDNPLPESCTAGEAFHWYKEQAALTVCKVEGTINGQYTFDLNTWEDTNGGEWERWWVDNGVLTTATTSAPDCMPTATTVYSNEYINIFPNPVRHTLTIDVKDIVALGVVSSIGERTILPVQNSGVYDLSFLAAGWYTVQLTDKNGVNFTRSIIIQPL